MNFFRTSWLVLALFVLGLKVEAQTTCYTDELLKHHIRNTKGTQERLSYFDESVYQHLRSQPALPMPSANNSSASSASSSNITIPVVVYVVHNNGPENISDNQVLSQVNVLNTYFDSYGIQFCLATTDGSTPLPGTTTPGIIRVNNPSLIHHNAVTDQAALTSTSTLSNSRYLRIWIVNDINNGTANGYSMLPDVAPAAYDGIVMAHDAFGDVATCGCSTLNPSSQDGKILVHEVGHYLGLYHTFNEGCAGIDAATCETEGDRVCDTPPVASPNSGCPGGSWNTCTETPDLPDHVNNYMDYTNETCLTSFTTGQQDRMHASISLYRSQLVSSQNHVHTGINCNGGLLAGFEVDNSNPCLGNAVNFTASSVSGATYSWDFGDGTTATGANVSHTYTSAINPAQVTLTVSNGSNSVSAIQDVYVEACTPINSSEGHWYFFDKGGLDFSTGTAVYDNQAFVNNTFGYSQMGSVCESSAVQSDDNGNLLFYTDGVHVWNASHNLITSSLHGNYSSLNGALIVPDPANSNQYYIFTSDTRGSGRGFKYSKVQVSGTTATMVPGQLNIPITVPSSLGFNTATTGALITGEGISAAASTNGYWILTETVQSGTSSHFVTFALTNTGISYNSSSFIMNLPSPINANHVDPVNIQVSPDGKKLAFVSSVWYNTPDFVFDFDICDASIFNQRQLPQINCYGIEFSSDSKLLYGARSNNIFQFNIEPCDIESRIVSNAGSTVSFSALQMGPDNKIYATVWADNHLSTIHQPNELATTANPNACQFNFNGPVMGNNTIVRHGLPNMISATEVGVFTNTISYTSNPCENECFDFEFFADLCANSYSWNFGDPASGLDNVSSESQPNHIFSSAGTYTVTLVADGVTITTTVEVGISPDIEGLLTICLNTNSTGNYSIDLPVGHSVSWTTTGGTVIGLNNQPDVTVEWTTLPGTISATVTNIANGCTSTSTENITEFCATECACDLSPDFFWTITKDCKFNASGVSGAPVCLTDVTYSWDFGDGTTATGANATHSFANPGTYLICLTVTGNNGIEECSKKICKKVYIPCKSPCPPCDKFKVGFTYDLDEKQCLYTFKGETDLKDCYEKVEYFWDYGDGTTSTGMTAGHVFPGPGIYKVCLTVIVYNEEGKEICKSEYCEEVRVRCEGKPCPCKMEPFFDLNSNGSCDYTLIGHAGSPCMDVKSFEWYVNGSGPVNGQTLNQVFTVNTWYEVCLVVTGIVDGEPCEEKICKKLFFTDCYPAQGKAVQPVEDHTDLLIYPNPAGDQTNIKMTLNQDENIHVVLRSVDGRLIQDYQFNLPEGEQIIPIQLPQSISNGLIIVEINTENRRFTKKLMVQQH